MKVLNLLTGGNAGGIESLCRDIGLNSKFNNGFCFLFDDGVIYESMNELNLKTYSLKNIGGRISIKKYLKLRKIAKDYDIIAIHHGDVFLKLYCFLLSLTLKKKYVTFIHSCYEEEYFFPNNRFKKLISHKVFQMGLSRSDKIIFVSEAGRKSYINEFRMDKDKTVVVYNGIGLEKIKYGKEKKDVCIDPYNLTYIGRLKKVKGIDLLIGAVKQLRSRYKVKLSIVGDGEQRKELENLVNKLKISDITTFYGQQKDVKPYLKDASIFIYPSVWQEVFGISLVEAMAYGIPCVANAVGGIPEIIEDEKSGFLCYKPDVDSLAKTIEKAILMEQNGEYKKISMAARKRAKELSITETTKNLKREYEKILYK